MSNKIFLNSSTVTQPATTAEASLLPGNLLQYTSTMTVEKVDSAVNKQPLMVCDINEADNKTLTDAYGAGETCTPAIPPRGERVMVIGLSGQTFNRGTLCKHDGAGRVTVDGTPTADANTTIAQCAVDYGTLAADTLIEVIVW